MDDTGSMELEEEEELTPEEGYLPKKEGEKISLLVGPVKHQGLFLFSFSSLYFTIPLSMNFFCLDGLLVFFGFALLTHIWGLFQ
jgi:hypothetical protein